MDLEFDLNNIDLNSAGEWPLVVKAMLILVVCAIAVAIGYFAFVEKQYKDLERAQREEIELKEDFELKQGKAANLAHYKDQLEEMKETFGTLLRQLPDKTEVDALLVDVSQTGLASGLKFDFFEPLPEVRKEFYAELPIKIRVVGDFHAFGEFISGLAALPRIVTIHGISIGPAKARVKGGGQKLALQAMAKTYRYLEEGQ